MSILVVEYDNYKLYSLVRSLFVMLYLNSKPNSMIHSNFDSVVFSCIHKNDADA